MLKVVNVLNIVKYVRQHFNKIHYMNVGKSLIFWENCFKKVHYTCRGKKSFIFQRVFWIFYFWTFIFVHFRKVAYFPRKNLAPYHILNLWCGYKKNNFHFNTIIFKIKNLKIFSQTTIWRQRRTKFCHF